MNDSCSWKQPGVLQSLFNFIDICVYRGLASFVYISGVTASPVMYVLDLSRLTPNRLLYYYTQYKILYYNKQAAAGTLVVDLK